MPFNYLLTNLLVDVPEAVGAIFVDYEGEAVEWVTRHGDPFDLKVEGAYHGLYDYAEVSQCPTPAIPALKSFV